MVRIHSPRRRKTVANATVFLCRGGARSAGQAGADGARSSARRRPQSQWVTSNSTSTALSAGGGTVPGGIVVGSRRVASMSSSKDTCTGEVCGAVVARSLSLGKSCVTTATVPVRKITSPQRRVRRNMTRLPGRSTPQKPHRAGSTPSGRVTGRRRVVGGGSDSRRSDRHRSVCTSARDIMTMPVRQRRTMAPRSQTDAATTCLPHSRRGRMTRDDAPDGWGMGSCELSYLMHKVVRRSHGRQCAIQPPPRRRTRDSVTRGRSTNVMD